MIDKLKIVINRNSIYIYNFIWPKGKNSYIKCTSWPLVKTLCNYYDIKWRYYKSTMDLYDNDKKLLKIPIGYGIDTVFTYLDQSNHNISYEIEDKSDKFTNYNLLNIKMKDSYKPRDEIQAEAIKFLLSCENDNQFHQLFLTLTTGFGKTFCAIYAAIELRLPPLIISYNLSEQWKEKILEYTNAKEKDIFEIKGKDSIFELLRSKKVYSFYIASVSTLRILLKKYQNLNIILNKMKVGLMIFDEAHMQFKQNALITVNADVKYTFFLSATPSRSNYQEKRVFDSIFLKVPMYGLQSQYLDNHYKIRFVKYNTNPTSYEIRSCNTSKGFSSVAYYKYIYSSEERSFLIIGMIKYFADKLFIDNLDKRILVFIPTLEFMHFIYKVLKTYEIPYSIGEYNSNIRNLNDREDQLNKNLILTTIAACSTGKDIPNLKAIFSLTPFSSSIVGRQILGRLRKLKDGGDVYFYDFTDIGFSRCVMQCNLRTNIFKDRSKSMMKKDISTEEMLLYLKNR